MVSFLQRCARLILCESTEAFAVLDRLASAFEWLLRVGAFVAWIALIMPSGLDPAAKVGLLAVLVASVHPRLEPVAGILACVAAGDLILDQRGLSGSSWLSTQGAQLAVAWVAIGLVTSAGVLRRIRVRCPTGVTDRDVGLLVVGWVAALAVIWFTIRAVWGHWPQELDWPNPRPWLRGPGADALVAAAVINALVMFSVTLGALIRARLFRGPDALKSHPSAGLSFAFTAWGPLVVGFLGAQPGLPGDDLGLAIVIAGMVGVIVWAVIALVCRDRHLRTWGAVYLALAVSAVITMIETAGGALDPYDAIDQANFLVAGIVLALCAYAVYFHVGGARRRIVRRYRRSLELYADVRRFSALLAAAEADAAHTSTKHAYSRAHAVFSAAMRTEGLPEPTWHDPTVPPAAWLKEAADAGRWQEFRRGLGRGSALDELDRAVSALRRRQAELRARAGRPASGPPVPSPVSIASGRPGDSEPG